MNKKLVYVLIMFRRDVEPCILLETEEFEKVKSTWRTLTDKWRLSVEEQKPFELEEPVITSFDPSLIREFRIHAQEQSLDVKEDNPYYKKAQKEGFQKTLQSTTGLSGMLDEGYKY